MTDTPQEELDKRLMQRAIELAGRGRFTVHPNPMVGCVIAQGEAIVGEGWHQRAGEPHAEVYALRAAGSKASGATAYVTLEPCAHFGRTPPCADALIQAGVSRVVIAVQDPFHKVAGKGIDKLQAAGIAVTTGVLESIARRQNHDFLDSIATGRPVVRLKMATSLDGRTALKNGKSQWITGSEARADVQLGRAASGAILTGAGTVLADNPQLNVRPEDFPQGITYEGNVRQPTRVVIDHRGELNPERRIFADGTPVIVVRTRKANAKLPDHAEELLIPPQKISQNGDRAGEEQVNLNELLKQLASRGINSVWCECGSRLAGALIESKLVDELILYQAPRLMGSEAHGLFDMNEITDMTGLPQFTWHEITRIGRDLKLILRPD